MPLAYRVMHAQLNSLSDLARTFTLNCAVKKRSELDKLYKEIFSW